MAGAVNPLANFNVLDTRIGDRVLNLAAITAIMLGNPAQQAAFAAALADISDEQPNAWLTAAIAALTDGSAGNLTLFANQLAVVAAANPNGVVAQQLQLDTGVRTATAAAGAATLAKLSGKITSEALVTAAGATYTLVIANTTVAAVDIALASLANGTNTQGWPHIETVTPGANTLTIVVRNIHASQALNGTLVISYGVLKNTATP